MTKNELVMDDNGKRMLAPLRSVPTVDPQTVASMKEKYLLQVEAHHAEMTSHSKMSDGVHTEQPKPAMSKRPVPLMKVLFGSLLALFILVGTSATVYASQDSLPGEPLYLIKSLAEDLRLSFTASPQAKLDLTLYYTDRRMGEISSLVENGKILPPQASERMNSELEHALQLAAMMEDAQMQSALGKIKELAKDQGMTVEELISMLPDEANPAIIHLQQRLQEQIELINIGEKDPRAFRFTIREREKLLHKTGAPKITPNPGGATSSPASSESPNRPGNQNDHNNNGQNSNPHGNGSSNPGNGNRKPTKTPEP